jgi:hypothetical protein
MSLRFLAAALLLLLPAALCHAQGMEIGMMTERRTNATVGLGFGIPYGGLGVSSDVFLLESGAVTIGIGSFGYTLGRELGIKYLYGSRDRLWSPEAALYYGTNGILVSDIPNVLEVKESYLGFTAGIGSRFMFGRKRQHGLDLDLLYIVSSGLFKRVDDLNAYLETYGYRINDSGRWKFSLGYRYSFDLKF